MSSGLGRGLSSLIPQKTRTNSSENDSVDNIIDRESASVSSLDYKDKVLQIHPDKIKENPFQPRKVFPSSSITDLAGSIKEHGIIQPLIITKRGNEYELIAGERRLRAAKELGLNKVPAIVRKATEQKKLELALIENVQREDLNPIDIAVAFERLMTEFNITQEDLAKRAGKSRSSIANILRLLNLPAEIKGALVDGKITEAHAKYLLGLDSEIKQLSMFRKIVHNNLSVNDTNKEIRRMGGTKDSRIKINYEDKDKENNLRNHLGTKVEIRRKGKGGQIVVDFYSDEELDDIIGKIK